MNTVRRKFRPKHEVLVLKCFPRFQKGSQDVKPNSSELSYLLYYATARRSKLQKVGHFLERKSADDVRKQRLGNVQVTLQILTAVMEKAPRDLPLYADHVLAILETVLRSNDINMIEESLPTFEAYCGYQDASSLTADQGRTQQYHNLVDLYANLASAEFLSARTPKLSKPMTVRWKIASLRAIRCIVDADALGGDGARQLNSVMPVVLENLSVESEDGLDLLQEKPQGEKAEIQVTRKRRASNATVATADTKEGNATWASGTTAESDKAAEGEVRALAVRCLKQIFAAGSGSNKGQVRLATNITLNFVVGKNLPPLSSDSRSSRKGNWSTSLIEAMAAWTPVQDRFVIVIAAVESLKQSQEGNLESQLAIATMLDYLLSSSINLIGLSVMDVLLAFVQHILLLLQLDKSRVKSRTPSNASPTRQALLLRLQKCIGDLATHIYYSDQISDMLSAVLARLKPGGVEVMTTTTAIENPTATANAVANAQNLHEDPHTDGFFSFATARMTALRAVKDILSVSNRSKSKTGPTAEARSRVGIHVWEGTQWLLRDDDREVRMAYVDVLLTWLKLETNKTDLLLPKEGGRKSKKKEAQNGDIKLAKRAVSNASRKDVKASKPTFLQLLHLGIYETAVDPAQTESDILLLHLLQTSLIERLGVNAVRHGLPMICRLQDDVQEESVSVGVQSLIFGYFWALSEKFNFETSRVGGEIHSEISRRTKQDLWLQGIRLPAQQLDHITLSPTTVSSAEASSFKAFTSRSDLVDEICNAYNDSLISPPNSPPSSPGRIFSVPALSFGYGYGAMPPKPSPEDEVSTSVREELLSSWSKDAVIAAAEKESALSLSGSRTGTGSAKLTRAFLAVENAQDTSRRPSPTGDAARETGRLSAMAQALNGGLGTLRGQRIGSDGESPHAPTPTSSRESTVRVADLKRALSGYPVVGAVRHASPLGRLSGLRGASIESARSPETQSLVSYSGTEGSTRDRDAIDKTDFAPTSTSTTTTDPFTSPATIYAAHNSANAATVDPYVDTRLAPDVPPVPALPSTLNLPGTFPRDLSPARPEQTAPAPTQTGTGAALGPAPPLQRTPSQPQSVRPSTAPAQAVRVSEDRTSTARSVREGRGRRSREKGKEREAEGLQPWNGTGIRTGTGTKGKRVSSLHNGREGKIDLERLLKEIAVGEGHAGAETLEQSEVANGLTEGKGTVKGNVIFKVVRPPY